MRDLIEDKIEDLIEDKIADLIEICFYIEINIMILIIFYYIYMFNIIKLSINNKINKNIQ